MQTKTVESAVNRNIDLRESEGCVAVPVSTIIGNEKSCWGDCDKDVEMAQLDE